MAMATCPGCLERDERIAALERRVAELEARLGTNATNSGLPPSANPPGAPKPVTKKRTGKKPGGQPGHPPRLKRRLPPERLHKVLPFVPSHCDRCHAPLPPHPGLDDPEPSWHQVAELPQLAALITEYQGHYRTCPCCGQLNHAPIPQDLKAHSVGPRLAAALGYFAGSHRASTRGLEEITEDVFDVPIALGTVANLRTEVSDALAPAHAEAVQVVRAAAVKHVDETSWKLAGKLCWLWVAATSTVAGHPHYRPPRITPRTTSSRNCSSKVARYRLVAILPLLGCRFNRLRATRRSRAKFWAAFRSRTRLSSSRKVTSSCQWRLFSIRQCPRKARPYSRAEARRLPMK